MATFIFLPDSGVKIKEIEPSGTHTAAQSMERGETDARLQNTAAAARLEEIIRNYGFSVSDLELVVERDTVLISGEVKDQMTREKLILAVGNIQGISKVEEEISAIEEAPEAFFHTVERADSLELIAEKVLGDAQKADAILAANAPMLEKKSTIYPGMVLRIPR